MIESDAPVPTTISLTSIEDEDWDTDIDYGYGDRDSDIDCVLDGKLYIGSLSGAYSLKKKPRHGITHILSVCPDYRSDAPRHLTIPVDDEPYADILTELPKACQFIDNAVNTSGVVYVHCMMGISRSASVVCAYLMRSNRWNVEQAVGYLVKRRNIICPNDGFLRQLELFHQWGYEFHEEDPRYLGYKKDLREETIKYISEFINIYKFPEERIVLCNDLPLFLDQTTMLLDAYHITHLLGVRPMDSSCPRINCQSRLFIDVETGDGAFVAKLKSAHEFISEAIGTDGTVLIHSFSDANARLTFAAYLLLSRSLTIEDAIEKTLEVTEAMDIDRDRVIWLRTRLKLFNNPSAGGAESSSV